MQHGARVLQSRVGCHVYGLVNKAIIDLILRRSGPEAWLRVRNRAGLESDTFISLEGYPDEVTWRLAECAGEVLGEPVERVLEELGEHWVEFVGREGYGPLLRGMGHSFQEALQHLDAMHTRATLFFPHLRPPSFLCELSEEEGLARVRYYSERPGLAPLVVGMLRGLGRLYRAELAVTHSQRRGGAADHDVFLLRFRPAPAAAGNMP